MTIQPLRVLVVDDLDDLRLLLVLALGSDPRFHVVGEATDGVAALEAVHATAPDLVLLDLDMPQRNGLEVLGDLAELAEPPVVVVLSGVATPAIAARARAAGAVAVLGKDTPPQELLSVLAELYASAPTTARSDDARLRPAHPHHHVGRHDAA